MKTLLAMFGACVIVFVAYRAGTMKYECISPSAAPMADGTGRWFYLCAGPEPRPWQRVSMADAYRQYSEPAVTARVSPAVRAER